MPRLFEWLGSLMFLVALIEFIPNPRKALETIPSVLSTNVHITNGRLTLVKPKKGTKIIREVGSHAPQ